MGAATPSIQEPGTRATIQGSVKVQGDELNSRTQSIIERVVKQYRSRILGYYQTEQVRDPTLLPGRVIVSFDIEDERPVGVSTATDIGGALQRLY